MLPARYDDDDIFKVPDIGMMVRVFANHPRDLGSVSV